MTKTSALTILSTMFLLVISNSATSQNTKYWPKYKFPTITAENSLWIGTPGGLYQYHYDEDSWSIYGRHNALPDNNIRILKFDDEFLWVATANGLSYGDIKLNKWIIYDRNNGLPGATIHSIAFQEDYVWIATDGGVARFDKLIQELEIFTIKDGLPDSVVYDIEVDGDIVYFGTAKGLAEYDVNFEKWRYYGANEGIISDTLRFLYQTTDYLWLFTDKGPCRFSKKLHSTLSFSDPRLHYDRIKDMLIDNEKFWLATTQGVLIYDPGNNIWRDFQEQVNLPSPSVQAMLLAQNKRWFLTAKGVAVLDEENKLWQRYDHTHGLTSEYYDAISMFKGRIFLINDNVMDYFKPTEARWYTYKLLDIGNLGESRGFEASLDREKGSYIQLNDKIKLSMSGTRFTYRYLIQQQFDLKSQSSNTLTNDANRGDIKAQLSLPKGRTVNAFYNNADFDQVLYGTRYKGKEDDLIQEINWGDVRYEQGKNNLISSLGLFGSSFRIEAGRKTPRYKRSLLSAKGWSGEKTSGTETEFFTGNLKTGTTEILDMDYIKNRYFYIDGPEIYVPALKGSDKIYIDDGDPYSNDKNTLSGQVIAGIAGDWDIKTPVLDYTFQAEAGIILFNRPIPDRATVVIEYRTTAGHFAKVIQKPDEIAQHLYNRYFIGGLEIIPHTLEMKIKDSENTEFELWNFGLDNNHDGTIDPEWVDYKTGILTFPQDRPFPDSVYHKEQPISFYKMEFVFRTEITMINLSHNHLIRGSETVIIDGEVLLRGQDYVLDYTSGSLLIIKEGIMAEDSEVQVRYEYYRDTREKMHMGGIGIGFSDNALLEMNYFSFDKETGSQVKRFQGYYLFGEFKWRIKNLDFKFTPEFAQSDKGNSMLFRNEISSSKMRIFGLYEKYDKEYVSLVTKKFQLGDLHERLSAGGTFYPFDFLDITTNWQRQTALKNLTTEDLVEENLSGKVLFSKSQYPAVSISGFKRDLHAQEFFSLKKTIKSDFEYQVPALFLKKLNVRSIRLYGVWRKSWEDKNGRHISANQEFGERIYDTRYFRFDFSPADKIQLNTFIRDKSVYSGDNPAKHTLLRRRQKVFFDGTVDRINGINVNLRYQGEVLQQHPSSITALHTSLLYRNLQSNVRFYPGKWCQKLAPFTFEVNFQPTWLGYLKNVQKDLSLFEKYAHMRSRQYLRSMDKNDLLQLRGEWRPLSWFLYYSGIDFYRLQNRHEASTLNTRITRLNQKVEIRPSSNSLITLQYFRNDEDQIGYSVTTRDNPMIWFENRWTERFQTKINLIYWQEVETIGLLLEKKKNFSPLFGVTYRIPKGESGRALAELRDDLSLSRYENIKPYGEIRNYTITNALSFDYYPISVFIMRFRWIATFNNQFSSDNDNLDNLVEIRLTALL
ncbi:hypothetical protein JW935_18975 [candidate division KSB1 bacterium]|nr:hypothetical protein [candidate division KSB1 bacterium]